MPTYVYKFIDSGETIEIYQAFSDDALTEAPHPSDGKSRKVKKVFTPVGVTFKGGGFYKTDSAASSKTSGTGSSTGTSATKSDDAKSSTGATTSDSTSSSSDASAPASGTKETSAATPATKTQTKPKPAKTS